MKLTEIIEKLKKYDKSICSFYPGIGIEKIEELERNIKHKLPNDFKEFLLITNGAYPYCEIYGIKDRKFEDLYGVYIAEKDEVDNPIREYLLPITPDGMGNHECLDLSTSSPDGETCNVIFWQHDMLYNKNRRPDIDAHSFTEYLEIKLKEIEEEFNYDGTEKIKEI